LSYLFSHPGIQKIKDKSTKGRLIDFLKVLNKRKIQITMLRSLAFRGIPCGEGDGPVTIKILRTIVWKVIIGYLPTETHKWEQHMKN
jgi:hypothetical protein